MNLDRSRYVSGWLALLSCIALAGGMVQCGDARAFDVTYYYLPG